MPDEDLTLSVRQPWAELIIRGRKTIEVRSRATRVRGRIFVYASKMPARSVAADQAVRDHGFNLGQLPVGVIVGSVCIIGAARLTVDDGDAACLDVHEHLDCWGWKLAEPARVAYVRPTNHPQPVFFRAFSNLKNGA